MTKKKLILFFILVLNLFSLVAAPKALAVSKCEGVYISQERNGQDCYGCIEKSGSVSISIDKITSTYNTTLPENLALKDGRFLSKVVCNAKLQNNKMVGDCTFPISDLKIDQSKGGNDFSVNVVASGFVGPIATSTYKVLQLCTINFIAVDSCNNQCSTEPTEYTQERFKLCEQVQSSQEAYESCMNCVGSDPSNPAGIWTAIGCIPTNRDSIFKSIMQLGLGLGGGFALITILVAAFQLSVSQGDPKQTGEAKDKITAAIIGLLFIIFSITILQFIGVKVLQIPGFGT